MNSAISETEKRVIQIETELKHKPGHGTMFLNTLGAVATVFFAVGLGMVPWLNSEFSKIDEIREDVSAIDEAVKAIGAKIDQASAQQVEARKTLEAMDRKISDFSETQTARLARFDESIGHIQIEIKDTAKNLYDMLMKTSAVYGVFAFGKMLNSFENETGYSVVQLQNGALIFVDRNAGTLASDQIYLDLKSKYEQQIRIISEEFSAPLPAQ